MEVNKKIRNMAVVFIAIFMMVAAVFVTDVPVSAASVKQSTVTTKVTAMSPVAAAIKWNKVSGVTLYRIWYRVGSSGSWTKVATVSSSYSKYTIKKLKPNTTYQFAVRGYKKENGKHAWTKFKQASGYTKYQNVTATAKAVSSNQINVTWNKAPGAGGYRIWRRVSGGKWQALGNVKYTVFSYKDTGVAPSTTYQYCVRAYVKYGSKYYFSKLIAGNTTTTTSAAKMTSAQKEVVKKIMYAVETGGQVYGKQDYTDVTLQYTNSSAEHAITIGAGQWYGAEAKTLLNKIKSSYPKIFAKYDSKGYIAADLKSASWTTYKLYPSKKKKDKVKYNSIKKIISSAEGIKCQDALMITQITQYETLVRSNYGVTDPKAVAECINIIHQGGSGSLTRVLKKTAKPYTLDNIYNAMKTDTGNQVGAYRTRQNKVYAWLNQYM